MSFTAIDDEPKGFTAVGNDNEGILDNAVSDIGDLASGAVQAAKGIAMSPVTIPMSIYQTGQQLAQGQPIGQTNLGQQAQQLSQMPGKIWDRAKQIVTHPIDSFQQHPIKTALDVASVAAPIAGSLLPEASMAEMAAPGTSAVGNAAQDYALNAIGASKRFLNNPLKDAKMHQTAQTLLDNGIIGAGSTAKGLASKISDLADTSGKAIGSYLKSMGTDSNFINLDDLKNAVESLRPVQDSTGKVLKGGKYNAINSKIDDAIETIDAHAPQYSQAKTTVVNGQPGTELQTTGMGLLKGSAAPDQEIDRWTGLPMTKTSGAYDPRGGNTVYGITGNVPTQSPSTIIQSGGKPLNLTGISQPQAIGFEEANKLKGVFQDAANWQSNKETTVLDRMIAGRVRETLDNALDQKAQSLGNPAAHQDFLLNKQKYSAAMNAQDPIYNRISSEIGNDKMGLTDYILAAGAITQGNIGEAIALLGGKKLARTFGPSTAAVGLNKLNNVNVKSLGLVPGAMNAGSTLGLGSNNDRGSSQ